MREIKFRAWQFEPSLHRKPGMYPVDTLVFYPEHGGGEAFLVDHETGSNSSEYLDDINLMQYTGLKDKNGKEIYEGDILDCPDYRDVVIWDSDRFGFWLEDFTHDELYKENFTSCEVFGNIYENPELLK